jgi:hypothetical protein
MTGSNDAKQVPMAGVSPKDIYQGLSKRFESFRDTQYKLPGIFAGLVGGLWYFAVQEIGKNSAIAATVFVFAAAAGLACINAMNRFRQAFNQYLDRINAFEGQHAVSVKNGRLSTNQGMVLLLALSVVLSVCGVAYSVLVSRAQLAASESGKIVADTNSGRR